MRRPLIAVSSLLALVLLISGCDQVRINLGDQPANTARVTPPPPPPPPPAPAPQPAVTAQSLPAAPAAVATAKPVAALLLPLTGPSAQVGAAMLNAAQLALFEVADDQFTLLPLDTKGTPDGAAAAANQALAQKAGVILGPLFAAEVRAVAPLAQAAGVNVVGFSTDRTVAGNGVYTVGFLPQPQVMRILAYARSQGLSQVAVLAPASDYGRLVAQDAARLAGPAGVSVIATEYYDNDAKIAAAIGRLASTAPNAPAVLMADENGQRLRSAGSQLGAMGINTQTTRLLGTMLWDDARPASEPGLHGGWYPAPPPVEHANFESRFQKAYGSKPPRIASLAYDATALAAVLGRRQPVDFSTASLTQTTGFAGVDGIFRLLPDGTAERGFAIMEVTAQGPKEIAPAPSSFSVGY